jgi:hypothetical protein
MVLSLTRGPDGGGPVSSRIAAIVPVVAVPAKIIPLGAPDFPLCLPKSFSSNCFHQMVRTAFDLRISRSAVTGGRPSTRAVAPIMRSAVSLGYVAGSEIARAHARAVIGRTTNLDATSCRNDSTPTSGWIRTFPESVANSNRPILQIVNPLAFPRESSIANRALPDSLAGSAVSQSKTCVPSKNHARLPHSCSDKLAKPRRQLSSPSHEENQKYHRFVARPGQVLPLACSASW